MEMDWYIIPILSVITSVLAVITLYCINKKSDRN